MRSHFGKCLDVPSYLFEQEVCVVRRTGDQVLGQLEKRLQQVQGQVLARGLAQQVRDHKKPATRNNLN